MPGGRPRKINEILTISSQNAPPREVTRGDYFIERLASGASQTNAAELAGIGEGTAKEWIARGEGRDTDRDGDEEFATFATRAREAKAQGRAIHERTIVLAGVPRPVTTTKTGWREAMGPDGTVKRLEINEVTTREEYDWRASAWALQHVYGVKAPVVEVEVSQVPVRERVEGLASELQAFLAGRESAQSEESAAES